MTTAAQDHAVLARVIPLQRPGRPAADHPAAGSPPAPREGWPDDGAVRRLVGVLERRGGAAAAGLPATLGRAALRAQHLLEVGPTGVEPEGTAPGHAINLARRLIAAIDGLASLVHEEAEVLGAALAASPDQLELTDLRDVVEAVLALSTAPRAVPEWASPAAADAAAVVLAAAEDDLRSAAAAHAALYARYTDAVWDVPEALLAAGTRWFRLLARTRARRALRVVSRTGRLPGRTRDAARVALDAHDARRRVERLAPLLDHHLGDLDRGVLTDVDAAWAALRAVQRLHGALGEHLDVERLAALLEADAFRAYEVVAPASNLRAALQAWSADAGRAVPEPLAATIDALERWARDCTGALPPLVEGANAADELEVPIPTLASLVDVLLLRERLEELCAAAEAAGASAGSAS